MSSGRMGPPACSVSPHVQAGVVVPGNAGVPPARTFSDRCIAADPASTGCRGGRAGRPRSQGETLSLLFGVAQHQPRPHGPRPSRRKSWIDPVPRPCCTGTVGPASDCPPSPNGQSAPAFHCPRELNGQSARVWRCPWPRNGQITPVSGCAPGRNGQLAPRIGQSVPWNGQSLDRNGLSVSRSGLSD